MQDFTQNPLPSGATIDLDPIGGRRAVLAVADYERDIDILRAEIKVRREHANAVREWCDDGARFDGENHKKLDECYDRLDAAMAAVDASGLLNA